MNPGNRTPVAPELVPHGGPRGGRADSHVRLDLSTNVNPFGAAPAVLAQARAADLSAYPDPTSFEARHTAACAWKRPVEEIAFGAGVSELLPALFSAMLADNDAVVVAAPAYGEYARAAHLLGARCVHVRRRSHVPRTSRLMAALRRFRPKLMVVIAPGNPLGDGWSVEELALLASTAEAQRCLLVIDQSYDAFLDQPIGDPALPGHPAVVHLRSLTKDFALAGVRAAFATAPAPLITAMERWRAPWAASAPAQAAAIASFSPDAQAHCLASTRALRRGVTTFARALREQGVGVRDTAVHWLLCRMSNAQAHRLEQQAGIRVRTLDDHLMMGLVRVVVPLPHHCAEVVAAIADLHRPARTPPFTPEPI
jgi:histidinol-phosphate/aromatic aminotransferase/cobyric acid decarboxylase-like protein